MSMRRERTGTGFHQFKREAPVSTFPNDFSHHVNFNNLTYFWPAGNFHVVTNMEDAKEALKNPLISANRATFFISRMPNMDLGLIQDFFSVVSKMMVMADGDDHKRKRQAATGGFEDHVLERFKDKVEKSVESLLKEAFSKDKIDFANDVAKKLPSTVLADLFCIPEEDRESFFQNSIKMTAFFGGGTGYENADGIKVNSAASALKNYFAQLIEKRRVIPGDDYVSSLLKVQARFHLTDDEIISQAIMMLVAGQVTTTDQVCNNMFLLGSRPQDQARLKSHPELIYNALEEYKRFDPAVTFIFRVAAADTQIGDQPIKAGDTIFISTHCVNRSNLTDGDEINIERENIQHMAYGYGAHYCIGAKLGRMEMNLLFKSLIENYPELRVSSAIRDHYSLSFSGFSELILERV
jgi:cytochrome P450